MGVHGADGARYVDCAAHLAQPLRAALRGAVMAEGWTLPKVAGAITAVGVIAGALWWLIEWRVAKYIKETANPSTARCVLIPTSGHNIIPAKRGEWAIIEWRNIERIADCGAPDLTAVVVNGDGILHDTELGTSGVKLDPGITPELRYRFRIPESAEPGTAWFRVTMDFHEEGRTINSPRVFFEIPEE